MVITKYIIYAVLIAFVSLAFLRPQQAQAGISSISSVLVIAWFDKDGLEPVNKFP